jgi:glycosyltransferase involved in cell wall biosynthesis
MDFTKPRVAIYYDVLPQTGMRNDGAPLFMGYNFRKIINEDTFEKMGKEGMADGGNVVHLSPINPLEQHGKFDLNVLVDYGEDTLGIPLGWEIPHPNVYWAFDTHIDEKGYAYRLNRAKQFDHVFLCHKAQISDFIRDGIDPKKIHYLPVAAETDCYRPYSVMPKWNWSFIGHMNSPHRIDLLDRFIKEFGLGDQKGYLGYRIPQIQGHCVLDDAAKKFSMSRLTVNYSIRGDLNMRVFESMACRTLLLTDDIPAIHEFFKDGEHLVLYKDIDDAVDKAKELLSDSQKILRIAQAGYQEIISNHTYNHRAREILKTCIQWEPKGELAPCL